MPPEQRGLSEPAAPGRECALCPRLVAFRAASRAAEPGWWNAPVPSFGALEAGLLVVGLAPGLRGANRTGRPFTGDFAGDLLYRTLLRFGFARGEYGARGDDGFALIGCRVTNAVRCVPPANRPLPAEARACGDFLAAEMAAMPGLLGVLALGGLAHQAVLRVWGARQAASRFAHGAVHRLPGRPWLADSYHVSRYNTNTGRLTEAMFSDVVAGARARLG
ncbi:MAG: uracil-DNA glycosylase [Rhodospirillales bacterium]|nr:uracil-DNA glycosylase [Rhodospirillales bacterium]